MGDFGEWNYGDTLAILHHLRRRQSFARPDEVPGGPPLYLLSSRRVTVMNGVPETFYDDWRRPILDPYPTAGWWTGYTEFVLEFFEDPTMQDISYPSTPNGGDHDDEGGAGSTSRGGGG